MGSVWQDNAARFASTPESVGEVAAVRRREGVRQAVELLVEGRPGRAEYVVQRSFMDQLRIVGLGYAAIPGLPYECGGPVSGSVVPLRRRGRHEAAGGAR